MVYVVAVVVVVTTTTVHATFTVKITAQPVG